MGDIKVGRTGGIITLYVGIATFFSLPQNNCLCVNLNPQMQEMFGCCAEYGVRPITEIVYDGDRLTMPPMSTEASITARLHVQLSDIQVSYLFFYDLLLSMKKPQQRIQTILICLNSCFLLILIVQYVV